MTKTSPSFIYEIPTYKSKNYGGERERDRSDQHPE